MGTRVSFKDIPDGGQEFRLVPLGKYPARLKVDAYQHDDNGNYLTDGEGDRVMWRTKKGDEMWKLQFQILATEAADRIVFDNLNFSEGGKKRVKIMFRRAGYPEDYEGEPDPEDLDGTYWNIDVDSHELQTTATGAITISKYKFKNKIDCKCSVCVGNDDKEVRINPKIGFAGFELMPLKDAVMYKAVTPNESNPSMEAGACFPCTNGDHSHKAGKNCPCMNGDHPPF